jgi:hypothetical protein
VTAGAGFGAQLCGPARPKLAKQEGREVWAAHFAHSLDSSSTRVRNGRLLRAQPPTGAVITTYSMG